MSKLITLISSWKTTLAGVAPLILGALVGLGVLDVDPQAATEAGVSVLEGIIATIAAAVGLIGVFSKDGDKSSEDVGI